MIASIGWAAHRRARRARKIAAILGRAAAALGFLALACNWGNG